MGACESSLTSGMSNKGSGMASPGSDEDNQLSSYFNNAVTVAVVVVSIIMNIGAIGLAFSGGGIKLGKTMKAPGRKNNRIFRDQFENDPAAYFRNLHGRN
ncbi:hypothetical protein ACFE04_011576 [Oxalis oulophora]